MTAKGRDELPRVADIQPSLLLFLKKLRKIDIRDSSGTCTKWIHREGDGDRIDIHSNDGVDQWRVVRQSHSVPTDIAEEKRDGVSLTELVLAFPLAEDGTADATTERPVYSFLPVRPYGFRFAIQADFILASSREDILADRVWNRWLRDSIADLFIKAVDLFKADENLRTSYLAFVPSADQVTDSFFESIPSRIFELLKETECILTASGRWAKPMDVLMISDPLRQLLTSDDVTKHLHKELIEAAFQADSKLLQQLGVKHFSVDDLVACLKDTPWLMDKGEAWLVRLFAYLSSRKWNEQTLDVFRKVDLVPLENGSFGSPAKGRIFLPLDRRTSYGFEHDIRVVRRSHFNAADASTVAAAREFLIGSMCVRPADPREIINEHILPVFEDNTPKLNWTAKDAGFLIGSVEYIKDHLDQFEKSGGSLERLTKGLYIKYVHPDGTWYTKATELYFSKEYGNKNDLESLFQGIDGIHFLDPAYLHHTLARLATTANEAKVSESAIRDVTRSWQTFFARLGVAMTIRVTRPPDVTGADQVVSEDLAKVINTKDGDRIVKVLQLLDHIWAHYRPFLTFEHTYVQRGRRHSFGRVLTAFGKMIRDSDWIPTTRHGLCRPSDVCLDVEANKRLLGDHVPYLRVVLPIELLNARAEDGSLYVFCDPAQNLFVDKQLVLPELPVKYSLPTNCRNTRRIASACGRIRGITIPVRNDTPDGAEPKISLATSGEGQRAACDQLVREWLTTGKLSTKQIAVLSPLRRENSSVARATNLGGTPIVDSLSEWRDGKGVLFSTVRSFKGLETDAMVLLDVDGYSPAFTLADCYVACSRAKHLLTVLTPLKNSLWPPAPPDG